MPSPDGLSCHLAILPYLLDTFTRYSSHPPARSLTYPSLP